LASLLGGWIWFTAELSRSRTEAWTQEKIAKQQQRLAEDEHARAEALFRRLWAGVQDYVRAVKAGKLEAVLREDPGSLLYVLARDFAHEAATCQKDPKLRPEDRDRLAERYAGGAVELLAKACDFGTFRSRERLAELKRDVTLKTLQTRPDFRRLVDKLEQRSAP
jgi:hypothetical protein